MARGFSVYDAVKEAEEFMQEALQRRFKVGKGLPLADVSGIKLGRSYEDKGKRKVIEEIVRGIKIFSEHENSWKLIPQVGCNIAMALPGAKSLPEVAGLTGRMVRDRKKVTPVGRVDFKGTSHVGRVVLTAMKFEKEKRAAMNIRFSEEILEACENLNLKIATFDREKQPEDTKTMEWGTKEAIKNFGQVPQVIYDRGAKGKEAMIRILGKDVGEVMKTTLGILKEIS